jgi:oligopeptidase B
MPEISIHPPRVRKDPKEFILFGDKRVDNYYWLNQRENPEVLTYLEDENNYLESSLSHLAQFRELLYLEMKNRIK